MQKENKLTSLDWNVICFSLAPEVKHMHLKSLLQNDLKSSNVLLKFRNNAWKPKLADMKKATLKSNPETCKLSNTQRSGYNKIYSYLAYESRNVYGSKTTFSSGIFSLGYMFKHLYPSSPIFQMLTSKMPVHDENKRMTILYAIMLSRAE